MKPGSYPHFHRGYYYYVATLLPTHPATPPERLSSGARTLLDFSSVFTSLVCITMLQRLAKALAASELTQKRLDHIEQGVRDLSDLLGLQRSRIEAVESKVERERLSIAELHGKAYRLLKRVQAETRSRTDTEDEPIADPVEPDPVDEITDRIRRRRGAIHASNEG